MVRRGAIVVVIDAPVRVVIEDGSRSVGYVLKSFCYSSCQNVLSLIMEWKNGY